MTRVLLDVNIVLDVLLNREPHVQASAAIWAAIEDRKAKGFLSAHAVTTIYYLMHKQLGAIRARSLLVSLLDVFAVAPVTDPIIRDALSLSCPDFEDAVGAAAARSAGCDLIVTRDLKGYRHSPIRPMSPEAALQILRSK